MGSRHRIIAAVRGSRFRFEGINGRRIFVARDNSNRTRHRVVASSRSWERKAAEKRAIVLLAAPVNAPTGRSIETAAAPSRSLRPLPLLRGCVGMQVKFTETFARETGLPFLPVIRSMPRGKPPHPFPAANKSKKSPEPISSLAGKFGESEEREGGNRWPAVSRGGKKEGGGGGRIKERTTRWGKRKDSEARRRWSFPPT